jgi:hypothetical protein
MRKDLLLYYFVFICIGSLHAQKKVIDTSVFNKWPRIQEQKISNDGKYFLYSLYNLPLYSQSCVIQQTNGSWKKELPKIATATFSDDSRKAIFNRGNDTIALLALGNGKEQHIYPANSFQLFMQDKNQWIACQLNNPDKELLIKSLNTNKEVKIKGVESYLLSRTGNTLVYITADTGNPSSHLIHWATFSKGNINEQTIVWKGSGESNLTLDDPETQLAFLVFPDTPFSNCIWHYKKGDKQARQIADSNVAKITSDTYIESVSNFSMDGKRLFFYLKEKPYPKPSVDAVMVDVWCYLDAKIQSEQYIEDVDQTADFYHKGPRQFLAVQDISSLETKQLQYMDEEIQILKNDVSDEWAIITSRQGNEEEEAWNKASRPQYYLMSTKTGERKRLPYKFNYLSPTAKYLLAEIKNSAIYTYQLATGKITDIVERLPIASPDLKAYTFSQHPSKEIAYAGIWSDNDDQVYIKDRYDLWTLDPRGQKPPFCVSNQYGRKNNIRFSFLYAASPLKMGNEVILDAFSDGNQNNGFFSTKIGDKKDPLQLSSGPYIYAAMPYVIDLDGVTPLKAREAGVYLVTRKASNSPGNLFWTKTFKTFHPLTDLHPEKDYNWYTSELIKYKTTDNRDHLGVLYKPENFDSSTKYPLIINIYEKKAERINTFIYPDYSDGDINIPFFVSNGYLVFTPDIDYKVGAIGESALQSIIGCVNHLSKMPFVNASKIGISGHSFGGFETLFTITHSNLFAAAVADAGVSNYISHYGRLLLSTGISLQSFNENGQARMGVSLWENPEVYIKNSPIFSAAKVNTPLLMVNNKLDAISHFEQGLQMLLGLRRLGKKTWLLQYDNEYHTVSQMKNKQDLTIRMTQFFDHYLKDAACPEWMLNGIPAKSKGIKTGYGLDTVRTPGPGLLTEEEARKMEQLKQRSEVNVVIE